MHCGDTLPIPAPGSGVIPHLWIVVTEPDENDLCIIVNLTTLKASQDQTVIIGPGERPFVNRPTYVRYSDARIADTGKLKAEAAGGSALQKQKCSTELLKLVSEHSRRRKP